MDKKNIQKSLAVAAKMYVKKEKGVEERKFAYSPVQALIFYKHVLRKLNRCSEGLKKRRSVPQFIKEMRLSEMEQLAAVA